MLALYVVFSLIDHWDTIGKAMLSKLSLAFLILAVVFSAINYYANKGHKAKTINSKTPNLNKRILVMNRIFVNQRIPLDGYVYSKCKFINVTLIYNATLPFELVDINIEGTRGISSDSPYILMLIKLMKEMGYTKEIAQLR
jgi:hypothetical protein